MVLLLHEDRRSRQVTTIIILSTPLARTAAHIHNKQTDTKKRDSEERRVAWQRLVFVIPLATLLTLLRTLLCLPCMKFDTIIFPKCSACSSPLHMEIESTVRAVWGSPDKGMHNYTFSTRKYQMTMIIMLLTLLAMQSCWSHAQRTHCMTVSCFSHSFGITILT